MNKQNTRKFHMFHIPLILAVLIVVYSVIHHTITKPEENSVSISEFTYGVNMVNHKPEYSWHYFQRGVIYGDAELTPLRYKLNREFNMDVHTFRYFDPSNPTPFMLTLLCLIVALFVYRKEKKIAEE